MVVELLNFQATDGVKLNGFITQNHASKVIIATHGMGSNCFKERERIIAQKALENQMDFLGYNNRGNELVKTVPKETEGKEHKMLAGTSFEDVLEGYHDIKGAILKAVELGYTEIYLQGHSLGSTKTVYTYHKLKEEKSSLLPYIKGVILLSLVDIPRAIQVYLQSNYAQVLQLAKEKESKNEIYDLMPPNSFIHPISVKSFLRYTVYNQDMNFAQYSNPQFTFPELNAIDVPLFMRWGNQNEMIEQDAKDLVKILQQKIHNPKQDIGYIDGADHGYKGKEEVLAQQMIHFIKECS